MSGPLSSSQIESLLPLLDGMARLIAGGTEARRDRIELLALGVDVAPDEEMLHELERWARLLQQISASPDPDTQRAVLEALRLRGVPDGPAVRAVGVVRDGRIAAADTTSAGAAATAGVAHLQASVETLDFGLLPSGQKGEARFTVSGSGGRIEADSDQVRVTPSSFGPEPTEIRVEALPLGLGMLWTDLRIHGMDGILSIPIMAQWQEVEATAAKPPPVRAVPSTPPPAARPAASRAAATAAAFTPPPQPLPPAPPVAARATVVPSPGRAVAATSAVPVPASAGGRTKGRVILFVLAAWFFWVSFTWFYQEFFLFTGNYQFWTSGLYGALIGNELYRVLERYVDAGIITNNWIFTDWYLNRDLSKVLSLLYAAIDLSIAIFFLRRVRRARTGT